MIIPKLFGATTLATMLAFNLGHAAAQTSVPGSEVMGIVIEDKPAEFKPGGQAPGAERGIIIIDVKGDPTALQSLLGGQAMPPGAEKGIVIINNTGDPTAVESLLGGQPLAPGRGIGDRPGGDVFEHRSGEPLAPRAARAAEREGSSLLP